VRPHILFPLFAPVGSLTGIGPRLVKLVEKLTGPSVVHLLWHLPSGLIDRRFTPKIAEAPAGRIATLTVRVDAHVPPVMPGRPYKVRCTDETGMIELVFFHPRPDYLQRRLPTNTSVVVSGKVDWYHDQPQMVHPDRMGPAEEAGAVEPVEPVYPLTTGLTPAVLRRAILQALAAAPELPEWQDPSWLDRQVWPAWHAAVNAVHHPSSEAELAPEHPVRQRLAFDELLANQVALAVVRHRQRRRKGRSIQGDGRLRRRFLEGLGFPLTGAQETAVVEILADMAVETRMLRLLQGDVGSGKTVVAVMAMLAAIEMGLQAAFMAPTEILARQHAETLARVTASTGIRLALLTGRDKGKVREETLARLAAGEIDLVIGTHALFQEDVVFADLGLAVIDEQHRFGVHQRLQLGAKGSATDILVMTATPIPRTLTLTAYGDMEQSRLMEKPPGRKPIDTRTVSMDRLDDVVAAVTRKLADGERAYWVCPLVEESESLDVAAVRQRHAILRERLGDRVGLVHGQMKAAEKDAAMAAFSAGRIDLLVATTVIEVGVDVPEATVMVIEHPERFGLAQLHQLRGRIGRGDRASSCLLLYEGPLGDTARARLRILRDSEDGFVIAEEDLRLRGAGDLLGTRQSGLPEFHLASLPDHEALLAAARDDARLLLDRDPELTSPRGEAVRILLYLFERDAAIRYLRSG